MRRPPFVWTATGRRRDPNRLFYGKSFAYPLFAAPFVRLFGTNGFLVLNALLLAAAACCAATCSCRAHRGRRLPPRSPARSSWPRWCRSISCGSLRSCSTSRSACSRYFCWLYKEVAPRVRRRGAPVAVRAGERCRRRRDPRPGDVLEGVERAAVSARRAVAAVEAALAYAAIAASAAFAVVAVGLFAVNMAISGEWNYQGGERSTFYYEFPLQTPTLGVRRRRREVAQRGADRDHLQAQRLLDQPDPQPRRTPSSAATPASCRISFRRRLRSPRFWSACGGGRCGRRSCWSAAWRSRSSSRS